MNKTFTCVLCPNGCEISTVFDENGFRSCFGNLCKNGEKYVRQEITNPCRTIATSVVVTGGELPLVSVRLTAPIPRDRIFDVIAYIRTLRMAAPVQSGEVLVQNILGLNSDLIATRNTPKA